MWVRKKSGKMHSSSAVRYKPYKHCLYRYEYMNKLLEQNTCRLTNIGHTRQLKRIFTQKHVVGKLCRAHPYPAQIGTTGRAEQLITACSPHWVRENLGSDTTLLHEEPTRGGGGGRWVCLFVDLNFWVYRQQLVVFKLSKKLFWHSLKTLVYRIV